MPTLIRSLSGLACCVFFLWILCPHPANADPTIVNVTYSPPQIPHSSPPDEDFPEGCIIATFAANNPIDLAEPDTTLVRVNDRTFTHIFQWDWSISKSVVFTDEWDTDIFVTATPEPSMPLDPNLHAIPVVSINTALENIWSPETGIYVWGYHDNFLQHGSDWERQATLSYFTDGSLEFSEDIGLRISGQYSRGYDQKGLRFYFDDYGSTNTIAYNFFNGSPIDFSRLTFRPGRATTKLLNSEIVESLFRDLGNLGSRSSFVSLYLNNEYWGAYWMKERYDKEFVKTTHQLASGDYTLIKDGEAIHGDVSEWRDFQDEARSPADYSSHDWFKFVSDQLDMQSYIDWLIINIFATTHDNGTYHNVAQFKPDGGKWRILMWDQDGAFNPVNLESNYFRFFTSTSQAEYDLYKPVLYTNTWNLDMLRWFEFFDVLSQNAEFRALFFNRFDELLADELTSSSLNARIDNIVLGQADELAHHYSRWSGSLSYYLNTHVPGAKQTATDRFPIVIAQLDSFWQEVREPVELSQFTASGNTGGINLTWRTEAETENRGFKILRSIGTPNSMVEIASYETDPALVGAIDPTENARTYMFLDSEAVPGQTNYYQLQHVTTSDATVTHQWIEGAWTTNFSGLAINELQADNESTIADNMLEYDDWFEIVNNSTQALSLDSLYVTDDEDQLTKHRLIGNLTIPAGEHLILWADGQPEQGSNHVAFSLSSDGEQLLLVAPDGQTILDQVDFMRQFEDHSYQRHLVAPENWTYAWQPSPGFANNPPNTELFLVLNEIMTDNETTITDEAGDWDPWLEIANPLPVELDLENLSLTNNVSEPLLWELPDIEIDGNGHILIWLDGETTEGDQHAGLTVDNGSGYLGLYRTGDQMLVDSVAYPALDVDNVHARIPDNGVWTMTTLATPGAQNPTSLAPILFINEFLAKNNTTNQDSSGEYDDWVEIYNPGSEPVLLLGMFLSDDLGSSTKWAFPDVSIGPEEYLLIWCDDDPEQGPLHATFKLGASGEEIGLFSSLADGNDLIDGYSFGNQSADISEGRLQDGSLPWVFFTEPTPETTNIDVTAIEQHLPTMNGISQCHPNPFNPSVTIEYSVSAKQLASLAIYDIRGRKMRSLINGTVPAGDHLIKWDGLDNNGTSLPSGVYFVRLSFEGFAQTNKITLLR